MANLSISIKQQSIATIAALAAQGDLDNLEKSLHTGLDAKLTINEIKEILIQLYAYVGFPRSINAINTFIRVLASRQSSGIIDEIGKEPSPRRDQKSKLELGCEMQMALLGALETEPALSFIPTIDTFIKEHLYYLYKAIEEGANCFGYHLWAPIDCFSWRNSYRNRYGLISVNYHTQKKSLKKSAHFFRTLSETSSIEISEFEMKK